ncbi:tetratricopeptide repeat protein [Thermodesulfobacteriota bacterium]
MGGINIQKKPFIKKYRNLLFFFIIAATTFFVYQHVQNLDFVFDDHQYITENRLVHGPVTLNSILWAFTTTHDGNWHPLTWLSHMLDCQLFGLNPGRHHLVNLLFHIANTLLLFSVFEKMTGDFRKSAFVAALFALHPLHVESVAWVAERKDVLSMFFGLLTLRGYVRWVEHPGVSRYLTVLLFFTLGLMAKPMLVTLPFVLLLLDYWPLHRFRTKPSNNPETGHQRAVLSGLIREKIPLFILTSISAVLTFMAEKKGGSMSALDAIPLKSRMANALISYVNYIIKTVWPAKMTVLYPLQETFPWWKVAGACVVLITVTFLAIKSIKRHPFFTVGWCWYLGTLVPVIGLVQVGVQSMADRYTYIPLVGIFIIIAWGAPELVAQWRYRKIWLATLASVILAILMVSTWKQVRYWENSITLFEHALKITSNSYVPHYNLGHALAKQGRTSEAIEHYLQALRLKPDYVKAHNNLGNVLARQGRTSEAIEHYLQALRIKPDQAKAHYNLGATFDKQGRISEAIEHYLQALRIKPDYVKAHNNLGVALFRKGNITGAIAHFREALRINPDHIHAKNNLEKALMMQQQNK